MSTVKVTVVAVASALVSVTLWNWLSDDAQPVVPRVEVVKHYVVAPPSALAEPPAGPSLNAGTTPSGAPLPAAVPVQPKGSELGAKLLQVTDVKAFVLEALKQPEKGGAYYADRALTQCSENRLDLPASADEAIQEIVARESTITQERMDKINAIPARCSQFAEGEIAALNAEAWEKGLDGSDPVLALGIKLGSTRTGTPEREKAIDDIYKSGNMSLISETRLLSGLLEATLTGEGDAWTQRFNGQIYTDGPDLRAIKAGAELSVCIEGDYCALDEQLLLTCLRGFCYSSREEFVRQQMLLTSDPAEYAKALKFAEQIRVAMARGDRSIFR